MTGRRSPGDLPLSHVIARASLSGFVALVFLTALALVVFWSRDELAVARTWADAVRAGLLP
jgi:hypothetical protein